MESTALIAIGFTCTAIFRLWLNCAQKFASEVAGMSNASIIMIASSLSNYTILSAAGKLSASSGPQAVITMNIIITVIEVILALFVNIRYGKLVEKAEN